VRARSTLSEADGRAIRARHDTGRPIVASIEHRGYAPADELRHTVVRGWVMGVRSFRRATTVAAFMPITSSA